MGERGGLILCTFYLKDLRDEDEDGRDNRFVLFSSFSL